MAKTKKNLELNRKQYQIVKKMDHNGMEVYLNKIYEDGVQKGKMESNASFDIDEALNEIGSIKGIGNTKLAQIRTILESKLNHK